MSVSAENAVANINCHYHSVGTRKSNKMKRENLVTGFTNKNNTTLAMHCRSCGALQTVSNDDNGDDCYTTVMVAGMMVIIINCHPSVFSLTRKHETTVY